MKSMVTLLSDTILLFLIPRVKKQKSKFGDFLAFMLADFLETLNSLFLFFNKETKDNQKTNIQEYFFVQTVRIRTLKGK